MRYLPSFRALRSNIRRELAIVMLALVLALIVMLATPTLISH